MTVTPEQRALNDANRLGLDYRAEAAKLPYRDSPIDDIHSHVVDVEAGRIFFEAADLYGIDTVWTMAPLANVDALRDAFGDRLKFIAVPDYHRGRDDPKAFEEDWLRDIEAFAERGSTMCKFWAAPRGRDLAGGALTIDSPIRIEGMKLAKSLGMSFMVHISDPDTWFATKYADASKYGTKAQQYEPFERLLDEFDDVRWIAAHMAGDPERLDHLQQLLDDHPNLWLDTSACKWQVRELSKHAPNDLRDFLTRNRGRVLFGSDIVARVDDPWQPDKPALTYEEHFDLYASRYWALRTLFETDYDGLSPIVDPDLHMVDPSVPEKSTAKLRGASVPNDVLRAMYREGLAGYLAAE